MASKQFKTEINGKELIVEIGKLAEQANGAVTVQYGGTMVLATCVMSKEPTETNFLPLIVDYEERFYAAGKIKGSRWVKRETRPSDEAVLTGRLIDRCLRPRFDQRIRNGIQTIITILSIDGENDPDIPALLAASCALSISDIPWNGPVAGLRISKNTAEYILNPTYEQKSQSKFDLVVAGTEEGVNMLEISAQETEESEIIKAIEYGQKYLKELLGFQQKIIEEFKPKKQVLELKEIDKNLLNQAKKFICDIPQKQELSELKQAWLQKNSKESDAETAFEQAINQIVHKNIIEHEKRPDGRKLDEIREITCDVGLLPRTHGSGLFKRGTTQVLSILTLDAPGKEQWIEEMEIEEKKRFFHHYNFPPYCVGEVAPMRGPGRREIGHGALVEKTLMSLMPDKEKFPYTIRIVSEILSSNGSSSMAAVSASSLALFDAGTPIKKAAAGIAMGLMLNQKGEYKILTDIQGPEDHHGDMDLKIAGTEHGITACQMDIKTTGLSTEILKNAFAKAKKARLTILKKMSQILAQSRAELSPYAPRIVTLQINPTKIREVIGPGGKTIHEIIDQTGVAIDIEDSGLVMITSESEEAAQKAVKWVENLTREVKVGEIFQGKVKRILNFGAMVEILPGQEGLIHISELAPYRIRRVEDVVRIGDIVPVKVKNIDQQGRINLILENKKSD